MPGVHRPISDTWMLAEAMRREPLEGARVLDLCAGTGALAVCASKAGAGNVVAVDLTLRAVISARINARLNGAPVGVVRGDLFAPLTGQSFDLIVSNPPYIPAESDRLPRYGSRVSLDAGQDGRALLDRICREAPGYLRPGGAILLVHSSICDHERTLSTLRAGGLDAEVVVRRPGPLGPVMSSRASLLRERGLLGSEDHEEIVIVRGRRPAGAVGGSAADGHAYLQPPPGVGRSGMAGSTTSMWT